MHFRLREKFKVFLNVLLARLDCSERNLESRKIEKQASIVNKLFFSVHSEFLRLDGLPQFCSLRMKRREVDNTTRTAAEKPSDFYSSREEIKAGKTAPRTTRTRKKFTADTAAALFCCLVLCARRLAATRSEWKCVIKPSKILELGNALLHFNSEFVRA